MLTPQEQNAFIQESRPHEDALFTELARLAPRNWPLTLLQLDVTFSPLHQARTVKHRLWNPLTDQEIGDLSPELFEATNAMHAVFAKYRQAWTRCLVLYRRNSREARHEVHYHYSD